MIKVKETLEHELQALEPKIQKARENRDYGTYKNLILAYKEVLNLLVNVDKNFPIKNNEHWENIIAERYVGNFIFIKKDKRKIINYANGYSYDNNILTIKMNAIDQSLLSDNQFKGYVLTHQKSVRNCNQVDFSIYDKYKVCSSKLIIDNPVDGVANYTLILKVKLIK